MPNNFTPRQWYRSGACVYDQNQRLIADAKAEYFRDVSPITDSVKLPLHEQEAYENAELMAASPNLLAALNNLANVFVQHVENADTYDSYNAARAAIAKARGEHAKP